MLVTRENRVFLKMRGFAFSAKSALIEQDFLADRGKRGNEKKTRG